MVAPELSVELCGVRLATPLIPASGTLAPEALGEAAGVYGAVLPKTVTLRPRQGNPPPRVAESPAGMVNSIGLQNPGVEEFLRALGAWEVGVPVFVSVAGETVEEFALLCGRVAADGRAAAIELNLSCPNVERGGQVFCAGPSAVEEVVAACRRAAPDVPLLAKLALEGVVQNALAAEAAGADGLTVMNTVPALAVDARARRVLLRGGLSGPAIKPLALRAVYDVASAAEIPVVGCGGVCSGADVAEFMLAGARAVQVGSAGFVRDPAEILAEFERYLREEGLAASELAGALLPAQGARPVPSER
ncbi:dihydroorotate oxidase B, catalytic subunit [Rubrobacter xylanophilus DSM 9941]|uniref:Dihydroorotate dehydrogenase n=1 Tax=Rubrobacter xylanophilus (strain DSM 9941 / JCM 11954 / NBRC 16129 / PRD-1) TaxID=266117 RepID=Q1AVZ1_RUBXD|nr:dihydroorotate dehydrogenase [Rubrobacter xylanophilus]ABG04437.1 dihydroorotate oxidase B, catalytic subunit [Rubrobacter xylanophilus DSM 9941]